MFIKRLDDCEEIIANDGCRLKEVLHADRDALDLPYSLAFAWVDPGKAPLPPVSYTHLTLPTKA